MANSLQEKIAQLRKEAEEAPEAKEEKGGKTLFQRNKEEKNKAPQEDIEKFNGVAKELDNLDLGKDAKDKLIAMAIHEANVQQKQEARTRRIANILVIVFFGCVVVAAVVGVIGLTRLVFGFQISRISNVVERGSKSQ